jgi:acyl dehydratase
MTIRYFDDFKVGDRFESKGATISEAQILDFALLYDPQPFHIDKLAAADSPFGGLIASGFQTLALSFRLFYQENIINACNMGSPGMSDLAWLAPVRPGDTLRTTGEVLEVRPSSSKPNRGATTMAFSVANQDGVEVMRYKVVMIMRRKAS